MTNQVKYPNRKFNFGKLERKPKINLLKKLRNHRKCLKWRIAEKCLTPQKCKFFIGKVYKMDEIGSNLMIQQIINTFSISFKSSLIINNFREFHIFIVFLNFSWILWKNRKRKIRLFLKHVRGFPGICFRDFSSFTIRGFHPLPNNW